MLYRLVNSVLEGLLASFFFPLLAWYAAKETLHDWRARFVDGWPQGTRRFRQSVGETNFEHAIEAYEELIDSTCAEQRS